MSVLDCTATDVGLFLGVNNQLKTCCAGKDLGSITENTVESIFSSDEFKNIKETLKRGEIPSYCELCNKQEKEVPGSSQANYFKPFASDGTRKIKQIDIRWNNTCNLSCRYCNFQDSSVWQQLKNIPLTTVNREYYQSIFDEVERNLDYIEEASLIGGEPLMLKQNEQLLTMLRPETNISVISNLSVKLENNRVYNLLKQRPNTVWHISFDNVGDKFEYVRHGAEWERLNHNIDLIKQDFNSVALLSVYGIWSATNAVELLKFTNEKNLNLSWQLANNNLDHTGIDTPGTFSIFDHDNRIKMLAFEEAKRALEYVNKNTRGYTRTSNSMFFLGVMKQLQNSMTKQYEGTTYISEQFLKWTEENEALIPPKKKFNELWPELYQIMSDK